MELLRGRQHLPEDGCCEATVLIAMKTTSSTPIAIHLASLALVFATLDVEDGCYCWRQRVVGVLCNISRLVVPEAEKSIARIKGREVNQT